MTQQPGFLTVPAFEVKQSKGKRIYLFAVDAKKIPNLAAVSRVKRDADARLVGYQRPEVARHIAGIREYLESEAPMMPNGIVVCFDKRVKFEALKGEGASTNTKRQRLGLLHIPMVKPGEKKPGLIVDGQQRTAAIREAKISAFPIAVSAFITDDAKEQTEQFILVNSAKPLPKGLLNELSPYTETLLPSDLHKRRTAARLLERLNHDEDSPLYKMIRTPTSPTGVIRDNSVLRMLDASLSDGALAKYEVKGGVRAFETMVVLLKRFWGAVAETWPEAWGLPPRRSRLMHGAGVIAVGNLMDHIVAGYPRRERVPRRQYFVDRLVQMQPVCAWTSGSWRFPAGPIAWNGFQNTNQDVDRLREYLQHACG